MAEGIAAVKYGLKIIVSRDDLPGVELTIDMPEVGREKLDANNPALRAVFEQFDKAVGVAIDEDDSE